MRLNVGCYNCAVDLYSLPLGGCDIVRGSVPIHSQSSTLGFPFTHYGILQAQLTI